MNKPVDLPVDAFVDPDDTNRNPTANPSFGAVLDARLQRRSVLRGGMGGALAVALSACGGGSDAADPPAAALAAKKPIGKETLLAFQAVGKGRADVVAVPEGYTASVLIALGDPLSADTPAFRNDGSDTGYEFRSGDHHDGMEFFGLGPNGRDRDPSSVDRGLLAMNHEALTDQYLHPLGPTRVDGRRPAGESDKEIPAHGVAIVEVRRRGQAWSYERASTFNRRITPLTPIEIGGPLRGNALMVTRFDASGHTTRGTINNCGTGYTPWGTLLTGEENWSGYFFRAAGDSLKRDLRANTSLARYGRGALTSNPAGSSAATSRHGWESSGPEERFQRFDISVKGASSDGSDDYRNELNGQGYIVEIDPYAPGAPIKKRSALGRFAHESAAFSKLVDGEPLAVYQGDDSQNEYCYKFVSAVRWSDADYRAADRVATGDKYLDNGKLYTARFNADGSGEWIELSLDNPLVRDYAGYAFADQADVLVNARLAADAVGATKMDRPEWCGTHPTSGEVYFTMTNNASRSVARVDAANPRSYTDAFNGTLNASPRNHNGQIVRLRETGNAASTVFVWDVYVFGAEADAGPMVNLSALTDEQDFSSPDGLWFSRATGICWIQTDDGAYTDETNCMMLAALPGVVGDGATTTVTNTAADGTQVSVDTHVGRKPTAQTLKRFLVGPADCEITGAAETADGRTLFINIQHPGESRLNPPSLLAEPANFVSHWPGNAGYGAGGASARPRSATIVITKDDGGRIGS